jgi:hypothetical protein
MWTAMTLRVRVAALLCLGPFFWSLWEYIASPMRDLFTPSLTPLLVGWLAGWLVFLFGLQV